MRSLNELVACNSGAGGYTERHFMYQTHLTEPQGKLKIWNGLFLAGQA